MFRKKWRQDKTVLESGEQTSVEALLVGVCGLGKQNHFSLSEGGCHEKEVAIFHGDRL